MIDTYVCLLSYLRTRAMCDIFPCCYTHRVCTRVIVHVIVDSYVSTKRTINTFIALSEWNRSVVCVWELPHTTLVLCFHLPSACETCGDSKPTYD